MKLCLSSLLLAAATTVSMADPIVSNDKNLRALSAEDVPNGHGGHGGNGHEVSTGCAVTVKMMGYLGLAGDKWDKIMYKACPGMRWGSHLATTGKCTTPTVIKTSCGETGVAVGDSMSTLVCFDMPDGSQLHGVRMHIHESASVSLDKSVVRIRMMPDSTPVATHDAPIYYPGGWNTHMFDEPIHVTGMMCLQMERYVDFELMEDFNGNQVLFDVAHSPVTAVGIDSSFSSVKSDECPTKLIPRRVDQGNLCMEALVKHGH